jgi:hypothetical protein
MSAPAADRARKSRARKSRARKSRARKGVGFRRRSAGALERRLAEMEVAATYLAAERHLNLLPQSGATVHVRRSLQAFFSGYLAYDEMLRKRGEIPVFETFRELLERDPRQHGGAMRKIQIAIERFGFAP